jgi:biotin synthase
VLASGDDELPALLWAAVPVASGISGGACGSALNNARSGLCPELRLLAVGRYRRHPALRMKPVPELVGAARDAVARGARRYCMVTSARGPSARDITHLAEAARTIRASIRSSSSACRSTHGRRRGRAAAPAGVDFINHNLNTSRRFYPEICRTHTYDDRLAPVQSAKRAGLQACSGVIIGMGETDEDLVDVALARTRAVGRVAAINFLHPIDGTPLAEREVPAVGRCLRALALPLTSPRADVRAPPGAGRRRSAIFRVGTLSSQLRIRGWVPHHAWAGTEAARRMIETLGWSSGGSGHVRDGLKKEARAWTCRPLGS